LSNSPVDHSPIKDLSIGNDDISVARRIAASYEEAGMDPAMAYDSPDDAMQDFGNGLVMFHTDVERG